MARAYHHTMLRLGHLDPQPPRPLPPIFPPFRQNIHTTPAQMTANPTRWG